MKTAKPFAFAAALALAVAAAVSTLTAQEPRAPRESRDRTLVAPMLAMGGSSLGVIVSDIAHPADSQAKAQTGVRIDEVTPESPADVITSVNGKDVGDTDSLIDELSGASGEVTIGLLRDKQQATVKATLESRARTALGRRPA